MSNSPKVDAYLSKAKKWQEEMEKLRMIILDCRLTEELKWGDPASVLLFFVSFLPFPSQILFDILRCLP
jgi:hypothetical protein